MNRTRWPAVTVSHPITEDGKRVELNCRIDLSPETGKAHGVMIWRDNGMGKNQDIDRAFDKISRTISRVIQRRYP